MNTGEFLSLLKENPSKELVFHYRNGQAVGANYHITEVKNITVDSVDCGAGTDSWKETVIQLWESQSELGKTNYMTAYKALGILNKVNGIKPLETTSVLKFEYGNPHFHTAQLNVHNFSREGEKLHVHLEVPTTDCKARETCGVAEPMAVEAQAGCCTPGSGCC